MVSTMPSFWASVLIPFFPAKFSISPVSSRPAMHSPHRSRVAGGLRVAGSVPDHMKLRPTAARHVSISQGRRTAGAAGS